MPSPYTNVIYGKSENDMNVVKSYFGLTVIDGVIMEVKTATVGEKR